MEKNNLIGLLISNCKKQNQLLYDSNLIKQLENLSDDEIIEHLLKCKYNIKENEK